MHHDASFMNAKIFLLHYISLQNYGTVPHTHDGGTEGATEPSMVKDNWDQLKSGVSKNMPCVMVWSEWW